jgi:type I restriction enzyme S subunit
MVPEGWSLKLISDVAKVVTGSTPSTKNQEYYGGDIPFVSPADLGRGKLVEIAAKTLTEQGFIKTRVIRPGSTHLLALAQLLES